MLPLYTCGRIILLNKNQLLRLTQDLFLLGTDVKPQLLQLRFGAQAVTHIDSNTFTARVTAGTFSPIALLKSRSARCLAALA
jgi:hypothetical protein